MYELDFDTCTMVDVIRRSAICQPSLLRDSMLATAHVHVAYSRQTARTACARIALSMASDLRRMTDELTMDDFEVEALEFGELIQAFGAACNLQLIPPAAREAIARRSVPTLAQAA